MSEWTAEWAAFIAAKKERFGLIMIGQTANAIFDHVFNYWIYIPIIAWLGPVRGGSILTVVDVLISLLFIKFYDWAKKDWLGIEMLKDVRDTSSLYPKLLMNFINKSKLLRRLVGGSDVVAFFAISILSDPFITTVCLRKKGYVGMRKREWIIFFSSAVVGNFWWTVRNYVLLLWVQFGISKIGAHM